MQNNIKSQLKSTEVEEISRLENRNRTNSGGSV